MKNNLLKYGLVLSLLLNASLMGTAGYTYYKKNRHPSGPFVNGAPGRVPANSSSIRSHLFEELSLKPEQRKLFEKKASLFHEAIDRKREQIDRLRRLLFDRIRADDSDGKAIETAIAEISGVQEKIQKMIVSHMLEFKSMLDTEQQKKFFALINGAMTRRRGIHCP